MAKVIMVQGTMSGVGKSLLAAGLCRIFRRDGYRTAPFKSQNMALNSFITEEGLEMGRAQAMQAEAAGIRPLACMNPVLLKPTDHTGSQVIVNGRVLGNMNARDYFSFRKKLIPDVRTAFRKVEDFSDIIVIEGAGSPAEINLPDDGMVNMGLADMVDAPVLLVGDIDRGGVFAQLLGTLMLLKKEEKKRVKGLVINKFRGDRSLLDSGIKILEEMGGIPVVGVVPYMELALEDEDSLTERFERKQTGKIDLAVIRYPRISNFTDFNVFEQIPEVSVRYVDTPAKLGCPDMVFLPGSKNTMSDLLWMRGNGLEEAVCKIAEDIPVCGICGGYQMLGNEIADPEGVEAGGTVKGMGLLPVTTKLAHEKVRRQVYGTVERIEGIFSVFSGLAFEGYEIHMGQTDRMETEQDFHVGGRRTDRTDRAERTDRTDRAERTESTERTVWKRPEGGEEPEKINLHETKHRLKTEAVFFSGTHKNVYGTYVHGVFDKGSMAAALVGALAEKKGVVLEHGGCDDYKDFKEKQYDRLADTLSEYLNMQEIYGMLREAHLD